MTKKINIDIKQQDIQHFIDIIEFLEKDKEEIIKDMSPTIKKFLKKENIFNGPFKIAYDEYFINVIIDELKRITSNRFNLNPEEAAYFLDIDLLNKIGILDLYKNKELYNGC